MSDELYAPLISVLVYLVLCGVGIWGIYRLTRATCDCESCAAFRAKQEGRE